MRPTNTGINPSNTVALANRITYTKRAKWLSLHALRFALAEGENCCCRVQLRTVQSTKAAQFVTHLDGWTSAAGGWRHPPGPAACRQRRCVNHSGIANALAQAGAFDFLGNRSILKDDKVPTLRKAVTFPQNAKMTGFWGVQQQHSAYPHMWGRRTAKGGSRPAHMGVAQKAVRKVAPMSRGL